MTTYYIKSSTDWSNIDSLSLQNGDTVELNVDLDLTSTPLYVTIGDGVTLDGRNHTITLNYASTVNGLIFLNGGTIQNIKIDGNNKTLADNHGGLVAYNSNNNSTYGTIINCSIIDITGSTTGGCLLPNNFGHSTETSTILRCFVENVIIQSGGFTGDITKKCLFQYCFCKSSVFLGSNYMGGFCGTITEADNFVHGFRDCYFQGILSGSTNTGGFVGRINSAIEIRFRTCYSSAVFNGDNHGGFIGNVESTSADVVITNSYSIPLFGFSGTISGGFIGLNKADRVILTNVYSTNSVRGSIVAVNDETTYFLFTNVITNATNYIQNELGASTELLNNFYTNLTIITGTIHPNWSEFTWQAVDSDVPLLKSFTETDVWDGSYNNKDDAPSFSPSLLAVLDSTEVDNDIIDDGFIACLTGDAEILTDKGYVRIDKINRLVHTVVTSKLKTAKIIEVKKFINHNSKLFTIKKGSIHNSRPDKDIVISANHKVYLPQKGWVKPKNFINKKNRYVYDKNNKPVLYHIKLKKNRASEGMIVNGILVETFFNRH